MKKFIIPCMLLVLVLQACNKEEKDAGFKLLSVVNMVIDDMPTPSPLIGEGNFEHGLMFRMINPGKATAFCVKLPVSQLYKSSLWRVSTDTSVIASLMFSVDSGVVKCVNLASEINLEVGQTYMITINSNSWYEYFYAEGAIDYPIITENFEVLNHGYIETSETKFPTTFTSSYYAGVVDLSIKVND